MAGTRTQRQAPDGAGRRLAIATARFHEDVTRAMLEAARRRVAECGASLVAEVEVAGSYDLPLPVQRLLGRPDVDAVVALGAIVAGETRHDEHIAAACFDALARLAVETGKPVGLGVTGPGQTYAQAQARIDRGAAAVDAALLALAATENARGRLAKPM